jgi:prepilin-type N-terminal cleavage/methylation domain-containing protein
MYLFGSLPMATQRSRSQLGFTLIEALITISIVGILAAIAAPSFTSWLSGKKTVDVVEQIEGAIKEAQVESIKRSISCTLNIDTTNAIITGTPTTCLPTGQRDLSQLGVATLSKNDSNISLGTVNLGTSPSLQFSHKGTLNISGTDGLITIYPSSGATTQNSRCIVISSGIGIIRTGKYIGTNRSTPATTDSANCNTSS